MDSCDYPKAARLFFAADGITISDEHGACPESLHETAGKDRGTREQNQFGADRVEKGHSGFPGSGFATFFSCASPYSPESLGRAVSHLPALTSLQLIQFMRMSFRSTEEKLDKLRAQSIQRR